MPANAPDRLGTQAGHFRYSRYRPRNFAKSSGVAAASLEKSVETRARRSRFCVDSAACSVTMAMERVLACATARLLTRELHAHAASLDESTLLLRATAVGSSGRLCTAKDFCSTCVAEFIGFCAESRRCSVGTRASRWSAPNFAIPSRSLHHHRRAPSRTLRAQGRPLRKGGRARCCARRGGIMVRRLRRRRSHALVRI